MRDSLIEQNKYIFNGVLVIPTGDQPVLILKNWGGPFYKEKRYKKHVFVVCDYAVYWENKLSHRELPTKIPKALREKLKLIIRKNHASYHGFPYSDWREFALIDLQEFGFTKRAEKVYPHYRYLRRTIENLGLLKDSRGATHPIEKEKIRNRRYLLTSEWLRRKKSGLSVSPKEILDGLSKQMTLENNNTATEGLALISESQTKRDIKEITAPDYLRKFFIDSKKYSSLVKTEQISRDWKKFVQSHKLNKLKYEGIQYDIYIARYGFTRR